MRDINSHFARQKLGQQQVTYLREFSGLILTRSNEVIEWASQILESFLRLLRG